ncbi:MAG: DUF924 family protein [Methyloceanibacter sp.]|jgi:uncharacterized protein (DUF924 family)
MSVRTIDEVIAFWFDELGHRDWFRKDVKLDATIKERFGALYDELKLGVPAAWLSEPHGVLASVLVLDQLPRNMFRGGEHSFATDAAALAIAKRAIAEGVDAKLPATKRWFLYLPFQHAENSADQARSVELFTALGNPGALDYALRHRAVIDRFGRFPHRNAVLGRLSTEEEEAFLKEPGASF